MTRMSIVGFETDVSVARVFDAIVLRRVAISHRLLFLVVRLSIVSFGTNATLRSGFNRPASSVCLTSAFSSCT